MVAMSLCLPRRALGVVLVFTFTILSIPADAWGCEGHMLVAEIARRHLHATNRIKADAIAMDFMESGPFPRSPDMVQAACWADDLKGWHQNAMKSWHYADFPIVAVEDSSEGIPSPPPAQDVNVVSIIRDMIAAMKVKKTPPYNFQFAMVNLIHFVGDIHMPLHASSRYSKEHPNGDRGGNSVHVRVNNKVVSLHGLWDSICRVHAEHYDRPLQETSYSFLRAYADHLEDSYKFSDDLRNIQDAKFMGMESRDFAINATYDGVVENAELSDAYLTRCKAVAEGRITLAGLRLASILNDILGDVQISVAALDRYARNHDYNKLPSYNVEKQ